MIRTSGGFDEPQGIAYEPSTDAVYVANGGDGSVAVFRADDFALIGQIALGGDADNVRVDRAAKRVYVGYEDGALAVIDPGTRTKVADIPLKGHPESFQLHLAGTNIFVNIPDAGEIAVVARDVRRQIESWPTGNLRANYPMALDGSKSEVIAIFRRPPRLERFRMASGGRLEGSDVCADSDDVFVDPVRHRLYVICGEGFVDTFDTSAQKYAESVGFPPRAARDRPLPCRARPSAGRDPGLRQAACFGLDCASEPVRRWWIKTWTRGLRSTQKAADRARLLTLPLGQTIEGRRGHFAPPVHR